MLGQTDHGAKVSVLMMGDGANLSKLRQLNEVIVASVADAAKLLEEKCLPSTLASCLCSAMVSVSVFVLVPTTTAMVLIAPMQQSAN